MFFGVYTYVVLLGFYLGVKLLGFRVRIGLVLVDIVEVFLVNIFIRSIERCSCYMFLLICGIVRVIIF